MYIRQPHVATAPPVRQFFVVHAQQVKHRCVQIVDHAFPIDGFVAILVGLAVDRAPLTPPPASHTEKPKGL